MTHLTVSEILKQDLMRRTLMQVNINGQLISLPRERKDTHLTRVCMMFSSWISDAKKEEEFLAIEGRIEYFFTSVYYAFETPKAIAYAKKALLFLLDERKQYISETK